MEKNGRLKIVIEGQKYAVGYVTQSKKKNYIELVQELTEKKSLRRKIAVYPHYNHQGKRGGLSFNLVSVEKKEKKGAIFSELEPGEFKIAGFWQYIRACEIPCITIRRNYSEQLAKIVKKIGLQKAKGLLRANHLPIRWANAPSPAFKYEREKSKKEQMPRYFVQLKVKWQGESGLFEVIEEMGKASTTAPKYIKYKD